MSEQSVSVVILCGGQGTRFREQTERKPKPMIEVSGRPLLWHLMSYYAGFGHKDFVLCLGYMGEAIKRYFLDFAALSADFTVDLSSPGKLALHSAQSVDWRVTCADTGESAMTGARLKRVSRYLKGERFMLTYGDGLSDVDIPALLEFHRGHGKLVTVTGVRPPGRFGELVLEGQAVSRFDEKPLDAGRYINGGFFVFERAALDFVSDDDGCTLEREPLERLAAAGQLMVHEHHGYWQCMDTYRDLVKLEHDWNGGRAPWRSW
jgi:glucose-1-phosphate cytidylyltransferase